jgi:ribokinase
MGKVVVVGSFNTDLAVKSDQLPRPGETILGREFFTGGGGKGANQAVAAARLGAQVCFVSRVGKDAFGELALENLRREKMDVRFVGQDPQLPTGAALIMLDSRGENCIVVAPGANSALSIDGNRDIEKEIAQCDVVLSQLEIPLATVQQTLELGHRHGKITILNPAPAAELSEAFFKVISILTPNESEAQSLTGVAVIDTSSAAQAAQVLHRRGCPTVIITMGAQGAYISNQEIQELVPARSLKAVDTTGAGDVFSGALASALSEGKALRDAVRFACDAASISVTRYGTQPAIPLRHEVADGI